LSGDEQKPIDDQSDLSRLTPEELREQTEKRIAEELEQRKSEKKEPGKPHAPDEVDSKFVTDCLWQNELGDGKLYAELHRGKFIFNKNDKSSNDVSIGWYEWTGHHWDRDVMNYAVAVVENVSRRYLQEADDLGYQINDAIQNGEAEKLKKLQHTQKKLRERVFALRSDARRRKCLICAHTNENPLAVPGDGFDLDPWVIACKNGVVDLRTGILRPGRPDEYIFKACPHEWKGINEPAPEWDKFINTTFESNKELIDFLQRLFGYATTGLTAQRKFIILHGQGQNGKGVLVETLLHVLGPLAAPILSEMLLDQGRSRSSAAPSPDIMGLKGLRMAFASETDEGRMFSSARVKWFSGGDTLKGRAPHARDDIFFQPTHTLFLLTNNKPHAASYDYAFWERMILVPFGLSFVNRQPVKDNERLADLFLQETLMKEAPGILAWLVRGCIAWQEQGLDPPKIVLKAGQAYKEEEDILGPYIEECCYVDPEAKVGASDLYDNYHVWFVKNISKKGLAQKKFGAMMKRAGYDKSKSGTYTYLGIGLLAV